MEKFFVQNLGLPTAVLVPLAYGPYESKQDAIDAMTKLRLPGNYQVFRGAPVEGCRITVERPSLEPEVRVG
jgi:hypothetical protein